MLAYDVEKLVRRASQTMEDTLDLWWYFTAFGVMYAYLGDAKSCGYKVPMGFEGVANAELQKVAIKTIALGLDLSRDTATQAACLEAFEERRDYYDSLKEASRKLPRMGTEALFANGFNAYRAMEEVTVASGDGKVKISVRTQDV